MGHCCEACQRIIRRRCYTGLLRNGPDASRGNVFTTIGSSAAFGAVASDILASTIVRTNFVANPANGDYNHNGVVDAADYVVWRNTFGLTSPLDADGNVQRYD